MNREIKFRAWNSVTSKMMGWEDIKRFGNLNKLMELSHADVMQYTGLKDRNGKEIYEGDIIKTINGNFGAIVVKDHCFEVTVSETQSSLYMADWMRQSEVIGNIYENPELLNGQQG